MWTHVFFLGESSVDDRRWRLFVDFCTSFIRGETSFGWNPITYITSYRVSPCFTRELMMVKLGLPILKHTADCLDVATA